MPKNIVYFVGAGLTKSLELPEKPIPLMADFVQVMAGYASSDPIILTTMAELEIAGLFRESCPECRMLAEAVRDEKGRRQKTVDAFCGAFRDRPAESIEDLLLRALQMGAGPDVSQVGQLSDPAGAAQRFGYAVNRLFAHLIGWDVNWPPLEKFLHVQFESFPLGERGNSHTLVNFIYVLILDRAVQRLARDGFQRECWVPSTGYGFGIDFYVGQGPLRARNGAQSHPKARCYPEMPCIGIELLKPHGSLNWLVPYHEPPGVTDYRIALKNGPVFIPLSAGGDLAYWPSENVLDSVLFDPPADPNYLGEDVRICILPPGAKSANLRFVEEVRRKEREAIQRADEFYILGWSLPMTDRQDQIELVKCALRARTKPIGKVVVVSRDAGSEYFERVKELFGTPGVEIWNEGFCNFVERLPDA